MKKEAKEPQEKKKTGLFHLLRLAVTVGVLTAVVAVLDRLVLRKKREKAPDGE